MFWQDADHDFFLPRQEDTACETFLDVKKYFVCFFELDFFDDKKNVAFFRYVIIGKKEPPKKHH